MSSRSHTTSDSPPPEKFGNRPFLVAFLVVLGPLLLFHRLWLPPLEPLYSPWSDGLAQQYSLLFLLVEGLRDGGLPPVWNPYALCGMPLLGDPLSWLFYLPAWVCALAPTTCTPYTFGPFLVCHVLIGALGISHWLGQQGLSGPARVAGAWTFVLAGKWMAFVLLANNLPMLPPMAWMPWLLVLIDRLWKAPSPRAVAWLALVSSQWFLGSHPQLIVHGTLLLAAYAVMRGVLGPRTPSPKRSLLALLASAGLGAGLILIQALPTLEMARSTVRGGGLDYATSCKEVIPPAKMAWRLVHPPRATPIPHWEYLAHVGMVALALVPLAFTQARRRRECIFWGMVGLTILAYSAGLPICRWAYELIPGFDRLRIPTRALLWLGLPYSYLAAVAVEVVAEQRGPHPKLRWVLAVLTCMVGAVTFGLNPDDGGVRALLCFSLPFVLLVLPLPGFALALLAGLAILLDQGSYARPMVQTRSLESALGIHPAVAVLQQPRGAGRTLGAGALRGSLPDCYAVPGHVEMSSGYTSMFPRLARNYLVLGLSGLEVGPPDSVNLPDLRLHNRVYLDVLGFRYVVSRDPIEATSLPLRHTFEDFGGVYDCGTDEGGRWPTPRYFVYENPQAFPRAWLVSGARLAAGPDEALRILGEVDSRETLVLEKGVPVTAGGARFPSVELHYGRNGFTSAFDIDSPAFLAVSEIWFPGWRATDNGQPIPVLRAGGTFCALPLAAGHHDIKFCYWPHHWEWAIFLSGASLLLCCLGLSFREGKPGLHPAEPM